MPVRLEVVCHTTHGDCLGVLGEAPVLGAWNAEKALIFETDEDQYPTWKLDMPALPAGSEFKLAIMRADGGFTWEGFWHNRRWPHNPVLNRLVASPFTIVLQATFGLDHLTILNPSSSATANDIPSVKPRSYEAAPHIPSPMPTMPKHEHRTGGPLVASPVKRDGFDISKDAEVTMSRGKSHSSLQPVDRNPNKVGAVSGGAGVGMGGGDIAPRSGNVVRSEEGAGVRKQVIVDDNAKKMYSIEEEFAADWEIHIPPEVRGRSSLDFDANGDIIIPPVCTKSCFEGVYRLAHGLPEKPDRQFDGDDEDVDLELLRGS